MFSMHPHFTFAGRSVFKYRFSDPQMEHRFRQSRFADNRRFVRLTILFFLSVIGLFFILGWIRHGSAPKAVETLAIARLASAAALLLLLRNLYRIKNWTRFEAHVFATEIVVLAHLLIVSWVVLNEDPSAIAAWNILAICMLFTVIPIALEWQIAAAAFLTAGSLILWFGYAEIPAGLTGLLSTPMAYFTANLLGIVYAIRNKREARVEFERLQNEKELRKSKDAALHALHTQTAAKERLFAVISHDLRGPIGAMVSIGELLTSKEEQIDPAEQEILVKALMQSAENTHDLLDNLLQWALHESDELTPKVTVWELDRMCRNCFDLLNSTAHQKQVALVREGHFTQKVSADERMIQTVVRNLLGNALKFTPTGGKVTLEVSPPLDGSVHITVRDTGVGISAARIHELLGENLVTPTHGTNQEKGTGLGFRLCREFVHKNGGSLSIESTEGAGTEVTFTVPVAP